MASYCCFRKPRKHSPIFIIQRYRSISLQDTLCLVLRPEGEVVVIEGIGGLGKTWAAKAAFEAARNSNLFDVYIWVSLSGSCSLRRCIEKIAACLSSDTGEVLPSRRIRAIIREHLARRKFLLVLDNAYFTEENILEHLGIPHPREQSLGSKVIVTTRTGRARSVMEPAIVITPQPLTKQGSYDLLREKIGKDISPSDTLESINNCDGMPLSIILLAGALCDVPTQEEFSELISTAQGHKLSPFNTMIRLVNFGYRRLPSDTARHCFLYCLLFPDDEAIPVKDLIIFWIMDGLIQEARDFHDANCIAMEILQVILKHRLIYLEDDDHVRMHDVIRETVSLLGRKNGYWYFDNYFRIEHLAKLRRRISVMNTTKEELCGSPYCNWTSTLLLRGNRHLRTISEEFFGCMGMLRVLDLSFTRIKILPQSISHLFLLRMLLLIGCEHLEKIQHIGSLEMLEVLNASGCGSLKWIEYGSFDNMRLLKILDLSRTSIECLPSLAASTELRQLVLQDCPCLESEQTTEKYAKPCDTTFVNFPYGVSKTGAVRNLQIGANKDPVDWMAMLWIPRDRFGMMVSQDVNENSKTYIHASNANFFQSLDKEVFELSDRFGMMVSQDVNENSKTYIRVSNANFFQSLDKDSPLWLNCFQKFQIVISPLKYDQTMDSHSRVMRTKFASVDMHPGDFDRFLEINGVNIPSGIEGILSHAELLSLKRLTATDQVWNLNTGRMVAAREVWIENCHQLENLFLLDEVQVLSVTAELQNLWISNMENLASFCQGMKDVISFSCLIHLLLDCCPKLNFLFPSSLRLPNLRSLHIRFCDSLESVFDESIAVEDALPVLQSLQLWELPELTCVGGGVLPSLKDLKVRGCAKLKKIPVGVNENNPFFTTIIGETQWWNSLIWDNESIKRWMLFRNWGPLLPHLATEG